MVLHSWIWALWSSMTLWQKCLKIGINATIHLEILILLLEGNSSHVLLKIWAKLLLNFRPFFCDAQANCPELYDSYSEKKVFYSDEPSSCLYAHDSKVGIWAFTFLVVFAIPCFGLIVVMYGCIKDDVKMRKWVEVSWIGIV